MRPRRGPSWHLSLGILKVIRHEDVVEDGAVVDDPQLEADVLGVEGRQLLALDVVLVRDLLRVPLALVRRVLDLLGLVRVRVRVRARVRVRVRVRARARARVRVRVRVRVRMRVRVRARVGVRLGRPWAPACDLTLTP